MGCVGVVVGIVVTLWLASLLFPKSPCDEASDARAIARSATNDHDATVALMQAQVKQVECDAQK